MAKSNKITGIEIQNVCGIEAISIDVGECGVLVCGENGRGKTSVLRGITAALTSRGLGDALIRNGADQARIDIRLTDKTVRRVLGRGEKLQITSEDGATYPKPAAMLRKLLGTDNLDAAALLSEKDAAKRVKMVTESCPATVTVEQLRKWCPRIPDDYDVSGHAFDVLARVHKKAYDQRTEANKAAKDAKAEMDRLAKVAEEAEAVAPPECFEPGIESLAAELETAKARVVALASQKEQAEKASARTAGTRERIANLRAESAKTRAEWAGKGVIQPKVEAMGFDVEAQEREVSHCRDALAKAEEELATRRNRLDAAIETNNRVSSFIASADRGDIEADQLAATLAAASVEAPSDEQIQAANDEAMRLARDLDEAKHQAELLSKANTSKTAADEARKAWDTAAAEAGRLDGIVKALEKDAPAEIMAKSDGIPGLEIRGADIFLDGVSFDTLCGAERIRLAVQIAKRANRDSEVKVLVCDGLECLSRKQLDIFVDEATADGWQLFGTRVTEDERVVLVPLYSKSNANAQAAE